jgi:very-short-patch-repair endonuclease
MESTSATRSGDDPTGGREPPERPSGRPSAEEPAPPVLLTRDLDRAELDRLLSGGVLHRLRRGAYAEQVPTQGRARDARREALARIAAVAAQTSLDACFSHASAALIWGCPVLRPSTEVHVIQRSHPGPRSDDCLVRHVGVLGPEDRTTVRGLPVTGLARTMVDCACVLHEREGLVIADAALRLGADPARVERALRARAGCRGVVRARRVLALADVRAESAGETLARWEMLRAGLPAPDLQVPVRTRRCWRYLDLGWPDRRVGLEFDGRVKYTGEVGPGGVEALIAEKARQEELEEEGWTVLRASWRDVHVDGAALALRVRRALARR